uniref:MIR domain-containing protein n=1 Tax=Brassica oleracea TaxID=3712 RepID=A0A3P6GX33_BRAOL|nr:unnamed protein product [Brassica oleracea]
MAMGFFSLALFLLLSVDSDSGYTSASAAAASGKEGVEITYGSAMKLMHEKTKFRLHSHDVPYGSGSGQQSVTGFPGVVDSNSYWIVKPVPGTTAKQGDAVMSGATIRLQHMKTRKWLHSHLHASPISGNLEVSCFGDDSNSDTGDHWKLIIEGSGKTWKQDQRVRLQHIDTSGYLHSHDKKYQRIAGGQQEVCGIREKRADNVWLAAEGVYLPVNESSSK